MAPRTRTRLDPQKEIPQKSAQASWLMKAALGLAVIGAASYAVRLWVSPGVYSDLWFHMKAGEWIFAHRQVPPGDLFSANYAGREWIVNAWLSDILLWMLYRMGGIAGVQLAQVILSLITFGLVGLYCLRISNRPVLSASLLFLAIAGGYHRHSPRPELFTFLLLALMLVILYDYKLGRADRIWLLIPLGTLWANLHMGFVAGFAVLGCFLVGEGLASVISQRAGSASVGIIRLRKLLLVTLGMAAATLINPYGVKAWLFSQKLSGQFQRISEWMPLSATFDWPNAAMLSSLGLLTLLTAIALTRSRRLQDLTGLLLVLLFAAASLKFLRQTGQFCLIAPIAIAATLHGAPEPKRRLSSTLGVIGLLMVEALAFVSLYAWGIPIAGPFGFGQDKAGCSENAIRFIQDSGLMGERIFNNMESGGWLIWNLWPRQKVFMDGRLDMYGRSAHEEYLTLLRSKNLPQKLEQRGIDYCYLSYSTVGSMANACRPSGNETRSNWALVFFDDGGVICVRRTAAHRALIQKNEYHFLNPFGLPPANLDAHTDEVMTEIGRAESQAPGSAYAAMASGAALLMLGRADEAMQYLESAKQSAPAWGDERASALEQLLGFACAQKGKLGEAVSHLQEALHRAEKRPRLQRELHRDLAMIYHQMGDSQRAAEELSKARKQSRPADP